MSDTNEQGRIHMKHCPRCGHKTMFNSNALNALSRVDSKTYICPNCGKAEGWIDAGFAEPDETDRKFRASLGKDTE